MDAGRAVVSKHDSFKGEMYTNKSSPWDFSVFCHRCQVRGVNTEKWVICRFMGKATRFASDRTYGSIRKM